MRKILSLVFVVIFAQSVFASPLVFKATKEITDGKKTELALIDCSKFRQVRIAVTFTNENNREIDKKIEKIQNEIYLLENQKTADILRENIRWKYDEIASLTRMKNYAQISWFIVEDKSEILLFDQKHQEVLIAPPSKLKITAYFNGTYTVYVWAD